MYESKRITISYPAVERLLQAYGLPQDLPSQTLAGYIERLIFECLCKSPAFLPETAQAPTQSEMTTAKPNINKLAAMAKKQ